VAPSAKKKKKVSRRRSTTKTETKVETKKPARRTLYGSSRRKVTSEETATSRGDRE
jgi:hypothetical protein